MTKDADVAARVRMRLLSHLSFAPTAGQTDFMERFAAFAADPAGEIFMLRGYAGTGKTTLMAALTEAYNNIVLLAPTGRAAKVLGTYTGRAAYTIHKHLYLPRRTSDGRMMLAIAANVYRKTLFIVDEASMIPDVAIDDPAGGFPGINLLDDLIRYVFSGPGCRLMLVGDTAQLPPVQLDYSPALDPVHLTSRYRRSVVMAELRQVVRQGSESGILRNATGLRNLITDEKAEISVSSIHLRTAPDVIRISATELPERMYRWYGEAGQENVMLITRSNKAAVQYNRLIRYQTLWLDEEIGGGDSLMVVRNNYTWLPSDHPAGFIANGDIVQVQKIFSLEERFGFRFASALLTYPDYPDEPAFEAMIMLHTLASETPAMTRSEHDQLFRGLDDYYRKEEENERRRAELVKKDPFYLALQVKFAYAITCHKAQGGQWDIICMDPGYLNEERINRAFCRWLYTAITRAKKELYLLNVDERFFEEDVA